jgi:hypothetical protein
MPTTSSCRFLRILAHVDGSRQAWTIKRNTSRSVLTVGSKGPRNALRGLWAGPAFDGTMLPPSRLLASVVGSPSSGIASGLPVNYFPNIPEGDLL